MLPIRPAVHPLYSCLSYPKVQAVLPLYIFLKPNNRILSVLSVHTHHMGCPRPWPSGLLRSGLVSFMLFKYYRKY